MSRSIQDPRLCFVCEQFDDFSSLVRTFQLLYFLEDSSVEMIELKNQTMYLKRISCPNLRRDEFFLGNRVTIFGRVTTLKSYGDEVTRQLCEDRSEFTTVIFSGRSMDQLGSFLSMFTEECSFGIRALESFIASRGQVSRFGLPAGFAGQLNVIVQGVRDKAIVKGIEYGHRVSHCHIAQSQSEAASLGELVLEARKQPSARMSDFNCSVVLIKPHILSTTTGGVVLQQLLNAGFAIGAIRQVTTDSRQMAHFMKPYKGVLEDYSETVESLSGTLWVVQVVPGVNNANADVLSSVRTLCGPFDPMIAKNLYPRCIRARFGVNRAQNAVHCSDIPEDGKIHTDFFFFPKNV